MELSQLSGGWAIVTGASAGIGRVFASALARQGMHVVLVARRATLLEALAAELRAAHRVQVVTLPLDLTEPDAVSRVLQLLSSQTIAPQLLVNNAGAGRWGRFDAAEAIDHRRMLLLNVLAPMELCHALLPLIAQGRPGAVVNLSSPAALQPVPFMAAYASSKAFLHHFSLALHEEWRDRGVYVQTLVPGPTATEFDRLAGAYDSALGAKRDTPGKTVMASIGAFAHERPLVVTAAGTRMQRAFAALAPTRFMLQKVGQMFRPPDKP